MATAGEIVADALRIARVIGAGETAASAESSDGLESLNDMLSAWTLDSLDLGEGTLASGDTVSFPDSYLQGVKYSLAIILAEQYGNPLSAAMVAIADAQRKNIRTDLLAMDDLSFDTSLTQGWLSRLLG